MSTSMDRALFGHVSEIERLNRELNGFPSRFAKLPPEDQKRVLRDMDQLRIECKDPVALLLRVKAYAAMYGTVERSAEGKRNKEEMNAALTARLEDIKDAAIELQRVNVKQ